MASKRQTGPNSAGIWMVALVAALGLGATTFYVTRTPEATRVPDSIRAPDRSQTNPTPTADHTDVPKTPPSEERVFLPSINGENVALEANASDVPAGVSGPQFVAEEVFKRGGADVKLLHFQVRNRVAALDFGEDIASGFGSMEEASIIKALKRGLGQFKDIDSFQIFSNGQPVQSLGHFELDGPTPVER